MGEGPCKDAAPTSALSQGGAGSWNAGCLALKSGPLFTDEVRCLGFAQPTQELLPVSFSLLREVRITVFLSHILVWSPHRLREVSSLHFRCPFPSPH